MNRLLLAVLAFSLPLAAFGQSVPGYISYQGKITDANGTPVGNLAPVNRIVIFRIWDSLSATAAANRLYSEKQTVTISGGEFSVLIGAGTPVDGETANAYPTFSAAIFGGPTAVRYLGVTVDNDDLNLTNDPESSPRQQMVSTPFALRAQVAESVASGGITGTALSNGSVNANALAAGAVTDTKLGAGAVVTAALADTSVTAGKLALGAVGTTQLADGAVTGAKLAAGGIDATKIADGTIVLAKMASNSIDSGKIVDGTIATADLANTAVDSTKLADGSVTLAKHAANSVDTTKLTDSAVTLAKHAANSVDSGKIIDGSVALADLSSTVQSLLPKPRHVYNQAVFKTPITDPKGHVLIPVDLGDLGNDDDGCVVRVIMFHRNDSGSMYQSTLRFVIQQPEFTGADGVSPVYRWLSTEYMYYSDNIGTPKHSADRLPATSTSQGAISSTNGNDWVRFYNFYPGSLRSGETTTPFNQNQNITTANTPAGPPASYSIVSIVTGTNKITVTVNNPHAIQVGNSVTLASVSGTPSASITTPVTAVPDRTSFEIDLPGAAGPYTGGTVTHTPTYHPYRVWAAVHPSVSARIIVSDR